jgi:hypothetical protein
MSRGWRRCSAYFLLALFAAVAAAPHHHLNPVADLVSDGPSNSGRFAQFDGDADLGFAAGSLVDDESCLACFHHDFVSSPAAHVAVVPIFQPLQREADRNTPALGHDLPADTVSRAPPSRA